MEHKLPELPWAQDALEPHISKETLEFHYGKHHNAYVTKLNAAIGGTEFSDMNLEDAKKILAGGDQAATDYFQANTNTSLKQVIAPIVQESMGSNDVAKYYQMFNDAYKTYGKGLVEKTGVMGYAKGFGVDSYIPSSSDENIDDYVSNQAIEGLFKMIAQKESEIRKNPIAQTNPPRR